MTVCARCEHRTPNHTLHDPDGPHHYCTACLFLEIVDAEHCGETATVTLQPTLVPA
jgi:late competence protein required for DNA uptake (superfamily II DNA/RNA helicase)